MCKHNIKLEIPDLPALKGVQCINHTARVRTLAIAAGRTVHRPS